jgi:hypothetical protein
MTTYFFSKGENVIRDCVWILNDFYTIKIKEKL